ncbi:MAG: flippase-like domain-containing protein [bacterium]|nr:flippase-like domain-containing protein [bacterium]
MTNKAELTGKKLFRYALQGVTLGVLATTLVFFFTQKSDTFDDLSRLRWEYVALLFPMVFTAWLCNGGRIYVLSRALGYPLTYFQSLSVSLSTEFGIAATPAGVGGAVIRLSLLKKAGVPVAHGVSMMAIDVAVDVVFFSLLLPLTLYSLMKSPVMHDAFTFDATRFGIALAFIAAGAGILIWLVRSGRMIRLIRWMAKIEWMRVRRMPARLRWIEWRLIRELIKMKQGVAQIYLVSKGAVLLDFIFASVQWCCRYGVLPMILISMSVSHHPLFLFLLQGTLFMLSLFIVLPGGGGGIEVLSSIVLSKLIPPHLVAVVILMWRFFTYHLYLIGGGAMFFHTCMRLHSVFPKTTGEDEELVIEEPEASSAEEAA